MTLHSPVSDIVDKVDNTDGLNQLQMDTFGCIVQGSFLTYMYRVGQKKLHTELMAITLSILNGFSKFFHCWKAK